MNSEIYNTSVGDSKSYHTKYDQPVYCLNYVQDKCTFDNITDVRKYGMITNQIHFHWRSHDEDTSNFFVTVSLQQLPKHISDI